MKLSLFITAVTMHLVAAHLRGHELFVHDQKLSGLPRRMLQTIKWTKLTRKYCNSVDGKYHSTLEKAKKACLAKNGKCFGVFGTNCKNNGGKCYTCKSAPLPSRSINVCTYQLLILVPPPSEFLAGPQPTVGTCRR